MYKEFRELSRADAVKALYQDMAARHRARFRSIHVCVLFDLVVDMICARNPWADVSHEQILRVVELAKSDDVRRPYIKQLLVPGLKFPLPHRVGKTKSTFIAHRPSTF